MAPINVLKQISDVIWEIPVSYKDGMRVPARIYGTEKLIRDLG
jgi:tRNA-splicing ligase RtcB